MASITIKYPKENLKLSAGKKAQTRFFNGIERNLSRICIGNLSLTAKKAYEDQIAILATFFQRLIARTPVDERYFRTVMTKDGQKVKKHVPDEEICREHWFIEESTTGAKLYSKYFIKNGKFEIVNNMEEINEIKEKMYKVFPIKKFFEESPNFSVGNDCKHFNALEFGYKPWKKDSEPIIGSPIGREHAAKNKHSIQAPVGMLRISEAEMESARRRTIVGTIRRRYKGGKPIAVTPSDKKLDEFIKLLKRSHRVRYGDIKRYLEIY